MVEGLEVGMVAGSLRLSALFIFNLFVYMRKLSSIASYPIYQPILFNSPFLACYNRDNTSGTTWFLPGLCVTLRLKDYR
jgi:hypothetical protein